MDLSWWYYSYIICSVFFIVLNYFLILRLSDIINNNFFVDIFLLKFLIRWEIFCFYSLAFKMILDQDSCKRHRIQIINKLRSPNVCTFQPMAVNSSQTWWLNICDRACYFFTSISVSNYHVRFNTIENEARCNLNKNLYQT